MSENSDDKAPFGHCEECGEPRIAYEVDGELVIACPNDLPDLGLDKSGRMPYTKVLTIRKGVSDDTARY